MGLVDYGSSGEDSEAEEEEVSKKIDEAKQDKGIEVAKAAAREILKANNDGIAEEVSEVTELVDSREQLKGKNGENEISSKQGDTFVALPRPTSFISQDIAWSFLDKGKVKIYAPTLPEPADEPPPPEGKRKLKASKKGCGLFALLPSPKNEFIKPAIRPVVVRAPPAKKPKPAVVPSQPQERHSDDSEEEDGTIDFFSLAGSESPPPEPVPDDVFNISPPELGPKAPKRPVVTPSIPLTSPEPPSSPTITPPVLDTAAISALCGGNPNRRAANLQSTVEVIDVDQSSLVADPKEWLTKELSREQTVKSHRRNRKDTEPTSQQRRKHQITYLAFQAKEQELELKNQWANNRMTRKQTQAKYGF
ncbi:hypothetical protein AAG570_005645 [Ranatra chinensis]|uniref:Proline-rich protein PRCC n=1 Tax=Ranatra chinensis TaxID=642074 RepID=A0ABD0YLL6_9HEMI